MPRAFAYFRVAAEHLPLDEITRLVGHKPTKSWSKGDPGEYVVARPDSGWCLHSPLPESTTNLFEHIESLLPLIERRRHPILEQAVRYLSGLRGLV